MATVSSLGVGSGLDLNSLLANIKSAEQVPLVALQKQQASYTSKLSAYGQISSMLSGLKLAAEKLADASLYTGVKASSSAADVVTASAKSTAQSGTYALDVKQLSQAQSLATAGVPSATTAIGGGKVTIEFGAISGGTLGADGKYSGATFAADSTRTRWIDIDQTKSSLEGIAKAINDKTTLGVTATIVNDGTATPNRLVLMSKQTGETSSMRISVSGEAPGMHGLSNLLTNDPAKAQAQSLKASGVLNAAAAINSSEATVTIDFGTISGGTLGADGKYTGATFTPNAMPAATQLAIPVNSSLVDIRDAINGSAMGVTASIVDDGSGSATANRLVLTSNQTGETSSMRIAISSDQALSDLLANDPAGTQNLTQTMAAKNVIQQLQQTVAAQNAKLTVNGIAITSATNTVMGAIKDVDMTVVKAGLSTLSVKQDTESVQGAVTTFVKAYNDLQSIAKKLTAFDSTSKSGAVLLGDSTLRNIQASIRSALTSAQPSSSGLTVLSQIGITFEADGTLAIDSTAVKLTNPIKLADALGSNMSGVAKLFAGSGGVGGYGGKLSLLLTGFNDTNGMLSSVTKGMNKSLEALGEKYTATSERIEATIARYKAQFIQLDGLMSSMNQTSSYLTQQFDSLNSKK